MKNKVIKGVKRFDLFSRPVTLLIKDQQTHKTLFGAFLSIGLVILMAALLFNSLVDLYDRTNPNSYQTQIYHAQPLLSKLTPNNFTLTFGVQDPSFATYIDPSIYTVKAYVISIITQGNDGSPIQNVTTNQLHVTPCTYSNLRQSELSDYFEHFDLSTNYCIDWDKQQEIQIEGTFDQSRYQYIQIVIEMCNENDQDDSTNQTAKVKCQPKQAIIDKLESNFFSLQFSSNYMDLSDPDHVIHPRGQDTYTTISSKMYKELTIYMQSITAHTDIGTLMSTISTEKTLQYSRQTELIDFNDKGLMMSLVFRMELIEIVNYRNYPKLQTVLAQIGGLWQVIFSIAFIIQLPISELTYKLSIMNQLYNFEGQIEKKQRNSNQDVSINLQQNNYRQSDNLIQTEVKSSKRNMVPFKFKFHDIQIALQLSAVKYFTVTHQKIKLKITEYFYFIRCMLKEDTDKFEQIKYGSQMINRQMDIIYIIKKLNEIDKIKAVIFSNQQIKLFDYHPKPTIPIKPFISKLPNAKYFHTHRLKQSQYANALEASRVFDQLCQAIRQNQPRDSIDTHLLESLDNTLVDMIKLLEKVKGNIEDCDVEDKYLDIDNNNL